MARPQVNHVKTVLDSLFDGKIDMSDYAKKGEEERKAAFYSRALAAYYLVVMADLSVDEAAASVTDGFNDNGIDAIYYDEQTSVFYIIQSKMIHEGSGEPGNGEILKFTQGISDLVDEKLGSTFNKKILAKETEIKDALNDRNVKLNIVLAYTGAGFSEHNKKTIADLMAKLNDTITWAHFTDFNLKTIHSTLNAATSQKPIEQDLTLANWGSIEEPYRTYYGQISAYDLAQIYITHGKRLFDDNIRSFIGLSSINTSILNTIQTEPENFIYFNNGVILICDEIEPIPGKTVNKNSGSFHCKGIQVINGAQTVGSLGSAFGKFDEQLGKSSVFVRLIPLNQCPENFGTRITMASNTQNRIEKRDFVSLDPVQHNIKTELGLMGVTYNYKRTEDIFLYDDKNCSLEEATIALAAYSENVSNCVLAKREIGKLWDDIKLSPYIDLFNDNLKIPTLWNIIKVYRQVMKLLNKEKETKEGRAKSTCTYGNYFILHMLFKLMPKNYILDPSANLDEYLKSSEFAKLFNWVLNNVYTIGEATYPTSLIHQLYRNLSKCSEIERQLIDKYQMQKPLSVKKKAAPVVAKKAVKKKK